MCSSAPAPAYAPYAPLASRDGTEALVLGVIPGTDDHVHDVVTKLSPKYTRLGGELTVTVGGRAEVFRQVNTQIRTDLARADFDLSILGFEEYQLVQFMAAPPDPDAEIAPEPPVNPVTRKGDLWICGDHRILCGDATSESDVAR